MAAYFTPQHTRCPIQSYEVFAQNQSPLLTTSEVYKVLDIANFDGTFVHINTTIAPTNGLVVLKRYDFTIKAIAEGGSNAFQAIQAQIIICGYEDLTLA
jgi:hypothetical protein